MKNKKITIIGAGNMGGAIVNGLLKSGFVSASDISVADRKESVLLQMKEKGVNVFQNNLEALKGAGTVILAVKPYHTETVIKEIKPALNPEKILISIIAGVGIGQLEEMIGEGIPIFRAMPNTAISLQESLTCVSVNGNTAPYRDYIIELFDSLGKTVVIPEELMAAATVLTSCGIAFALRYMRAAMQGGIEIGFGAEMAQFITAQTVKGAAELILKTEHHPEREIDKVTTPRGVTITGLNEMEHKGFSSSLIQGLMASFKKIDQPLQ
ncbi:Pyrroline-5-carboxylate reductase [hydrothermal vent metagenome]|uniref:Pyrroline-5-carboxylate reductase n=1 Tax=hydrothermal vent metagenome TaxID=652676 RepID=A0A3B0TGX9_9ZZZZ